jgi:hypothetical protein
MQPARLRSLTAGWKDRWHAHSLSAGNLAGNVFVLARDRAMRVLFYVTAAGVSDKFPVRGEQGNTECAAGNFF